MKEHGISGFMCTQGILARLGKLGGFKGCKKELRETSRVHKNAQSEKVCGIGVSMFITIIHQPGLGIGPELRTVP